MSNVVANFKLGELAGGAVEEQFAVELAKVLENIHDPNTDPEKARTITLTISFKADKFRNFISVTSGAKSSLAPDKPIQTSITAVKRGGRIMATEAYQPDLLENDVTTVEIKANV